MKTLLLLFIPFASIAQVHLNATQVRLVNTLLDEREQLLEASAEVQEWQAVYYECDRLSAIQDSSIVELKLLADLHVKRSAAFEKLNAKERVKSQRRARTAWILGAVVVIETVIITVVAAFFR